MVERAGGRPRLSSGLDMAGLGARLRLERLRRRLSLYSLMMRTGVSRSMLSEVERGQKDISTERLMAVARALDVTIGQLYLELARELGAGEPVNAVAWEADPRVQLRRMTQSLDYDSLRTVARFTTFLAMNEGAPRRRPIGFLR